MLIVFDFRQILIFHCRFRYFWQQDRTVLHHASSGGNLEIIEMLVKQHNLDVNKQDKVGTRRMLPS